VSDDVPPLTKEEAAAIYRRMTPTQRQKITEMLAQQHAGEQP
jgi:hypothetical protein